MTGDVPQMISSSYKSSCYNLDNYAVSTRRPMSNDGAYGQKLIASLLESERPSKPEESSRKEYKMTKRMVQVLIVDPDENVPLGDSLLFKGEPKITDLTDVELFYEIDIRILLDKHNDKRIKTRDKAQSNKFGKDIFLEPAKIRDLKMTVVEVAKF